VGRLGTGRGENAVSTLRKIARKVATVVADRISKNHLFEQPGERPMQEPLALRKERESATERARLANLEAIEGELLQHRVINHWATWCEPCIEELPALRQLAEKIGKDAILGISWDLFQGGRPEEVCASVDSVALAHGIDYLSLIVAAAPEQFFKHFDIEEQTVPQTWVFSEDFELIFRHHGQLTAAEVEKITALL